MIWAWCWFGDWCLVGLVLVFWCLGLIGLVVGARFRWWLWLLWFLGRFPGCFSSVWVGIIYISVVQGWWRVVCVGEDLGVWGGVCGY